MISFQRLEFNKWDILSGLIDENLIGNGGSGKVYRVITKKGQRVAVKSIRHEQKQGHGLMEKQFIAEVKILGGIWHNNIVKLLCCIRGKTTKLLVYEYMDKQCLHKWLHGKKKGLTTQVLNWETRLKIAIGAAQGLCYMHHDCSPPIVHRDIKSSNILVDSDFNVKIADFGLAKMMASEGDPETASAIVGTFGYIARNHIYHGNAEYSRTRKVDAKERHLQFWRSTSELTTGREAVTGNEDMNLAQWAHKYQREGNSAADAIDEEIKDPCYLEDSQLLLSFKASIFNQSPLQTGYPLKIPVASLNLVLKNTNLSGSLTSALKSQCSASLSYIDLAENFISGPVSDIYSLGRRAIISSPSTFPATPWTLLGGRLLQ
ncbi:PREDICTED: leucine-rich repeat receptor-like serine/threonine-protein kinase BAM1, partial [Ipomoea nil]|uniref:leucine-rich repeat receptor-like serine/threonine-protein kinase BAM1 n=1 Tax=Ipomoea nil TaxID=35883 RepID=UPI0009016227